MHTFSAKIESRCSNIHASQVLAPLANPYPFPIPQGAVVTQDEAASGPVVGPPQPGPEGIRPIGPHPEDVQPLASQGRRLQQVVEVTHIALQVLACSRLELVVCFIHQGLEFHRVEACSHEF